ncbi:MAG: PDZ domain-containing protein [Vicinamibacterales bacterium]
MIRRLFIAAVFGAGLAVSTLPVATAPAPTRLLRTPTVSTTQIAFAYANNIWVVDRTGGMARRVTSFSGGASNPKFSPDGRTIAFTASYGGNSDVYSVPAEGGEPTRLTWHPGADTVQGWTPDGRSILFASTRATWAPSGSPRFWTVPAGGGVEQQMALPRAYMGKISADGQKIAYRLNNSWDEERRNYRGGQNKPIWIVDLKTYDLITPPFTNSKDTDPVWVGRSVYFLSDRDGVSNVWAFDTGNRQLRQVTRFTDFDVKAIDAGGDAIVFEQAGRIHQLDASTGRSRTIDIVATGDFPWMMPRWENVNARITNMAISPTGKRALIEARGEIFTIPADKGDTRNLTMSTGSAERSPAWSPDGKFVSYFSDKSGEYRLVIASQDGLTPAREIELQNPRFYYTPSWSPDSKKLLYTDTDLKVWVMDIEAGTAKVVGNDPWTVPERTLNPVWSPDSKWVAYSSRLRSMYHAIFISNVDTGATHQVTDALADAVWPAWDAGGKYLWFFASRDFGLASQWLDMTSYDRPVSFGLYFAILSANEPTPLVPESDEEAAPAAAGAAGEGRSSNRPATVTVKVDAEGLQRRIVAVPGVPERAYSQLRAGVAGTVYYLDGNILQRYRLSERRAQQFLTGVNTYVVSADGHKMLYRAGGGGGGGRGGGAAAAPALFIVDADRNPPQAGTGRLDVELTMYLDPKEEFKQIFREGWRLQRDYLYVQNSHGSMWTQMEEMYGQLLPHVNHRADLNFLLDNMGAELAVGHSYVRGGDMPENDSGGRSGGLLGADFTIENNRYRISRIYDAENWNPELRAPLATPGLAVSVGDYILAVNGAPLVAPDNIHRLLDGTANRQTVLTVNSQPTMDGARQITVLPVTSEQGLRTRAFVEENRRKVDQMSGGKLAYVYLPNTGQGGYQSFNRYYFSQQDKLGVVVDERFNGGGSAADYIIDVLQLDFDGYFNNVAGDRYPFTSPSAGIWGPKVMIINEMAGSGGDLMPYMFRRRGLGPLIGTTTWGGLVHTADTPGFIDGGSMIAPRGGFFTRDGKWAVENEGVAPDIEVENFPKDVIAGRDPQLERAVEEALKLLAAKPVDRLSKEPPPPNWGQRKGGGGAY